jgi:hypothetical protein
MRMLIKRRKPSSAITSERMVAAINNTNAPRNLLGELLPVAASTAQTVPSLSSCALRDTFTGILLTKPGTSATSMLLGWSL